jgi:hypothetical protein
VNHPASLRRGPSPLGSARAGCFGWRPSASVGGRLRVWV